MASFRIFLLAGLAAALGGCATVLDSNEQQLELHAVAGHRELAGVGCVLANEAGRWFVVAPGRVTVTRSAGPLSVDCAREGVAALDVVESRFATGRLIGNAVVTGGLGYLVDRHSGAGFAYPATLTVLMEPVQRASGAESSGAPENTLY